MTDKKTDSRDLKFLSLAVVVGIALKLCLPVSEAGLTEAGTTFVAVFVANLILWVTVGTGWPTYLSLTALVVFGAMDQATVYSTMWGNGVSVAIISLSILTYTMRTNGAMEYIAKWFISRKIVHGRPFVFLLMLSLTIWVLGIVVSQAVICVFMVGLIGEISASCGYTRGDKFYKSMIFLCLWLATVMEGIFPFARPLGLALIAMVQSVGFEHFGVVTWMKMSIPFGVILTLVSIFVILFIYRPDLSKFVNFDDEAMRKELKEKPLSKSALATLGGIIFIVLAWTLPHFPLGAVSEYLDTWGTPTATCLVLALLCVIRADGKPVIKLEESFAHVPWNLLVFLGGVMFFATYAGAEKFGVKAALNMLLAPVVESMPIMAAVIVGVILVGVATQFMSNTVAGTVVATVLLNILLGLPDATEGLIFAFIIAVGCIANCAYCTYAASPSVGACLREDTVPYKESVKYSVLVFVIAAGVLSVFLPIFTMIL